MQSSVDIMLNICITQSLRAEWYRKQYSNPWTHFQTQMLKLSGQALAKSHTLWLAYRTTLAWSLERKMDNQLWGNCGASVAGVKPLWHYSWEYYFSQNNSRLFEVLVDKERMLWLFSCGKGRYISRILYSNWSITVICGQILLFNERSTVYWHCAALVLCLVYYSLSSNNKIIST